MADYYVGCHTPDNYDPDRRIQGLGFYGPPNASIRQWLDIDSIISMVESGVHRFWVPAMDGRPQVAVVVRQRGPFGRKFLQTLPDQWPYNNLLLLPTC